MAQIDTRHEERDRLFELYIARHSQEYLNVQIAQKEAAMEKEDIQSVTERFEKWKKENRM